MLKFVQDINTRYSKEFDAWYGELNIQMCTIDEPALVTILPGAYLFM